MAQGYKAESAVKKGVLFVKIDERLIQNGISVEIIAKLIRLHEAGAGRYKRLQKYFEGEHKIEERERDSANAANCKIVVNHPKYITTISTAFLVGNPVQYVASKEYDIEALKNEYLEQDIASLDVRLARTASIKGHAFELLYLNEDKMPRSAVVEPDNAFVVYNDDCTEVPLFGVYYYRTYNLDGACTGVVANVCDDTTLWTYEGTTDAWEHMQLTSESQHYFGGVPMIEYRNNDEARGDWEGEIPNIDAYNTLMSDRVDDKTDFVNSFLALYGMEVDTDDAKRLKRERILSGPDGAKAEYLSQALDETGVKVLRDDLKEDIHRISMVPDLSDDSFGNNLSGVAIKYKILGFEQLIKDKERCIGTGLKRRFTLYNNYLVFLNKMAKVPVHRVDVTFKHNLPANNLENAQMLNYLTDTVSLETRLEQLDFVNDAKEEAELVRKAKADNMTQSALYCKPAKLEVEDEEEPEQ